MKPIFAALFGAIGACIVALPVTAQDRSGSPSVPGSGTDIGPRTGAGAGELSDPARRVVPETERSRSLDMQRRDSPMTRDPRLGPGVGSGTSSGGTREPGTGSSGSRR